MCGCANLQMCKIRFVSVFENLGNVQMCKFAKFNSDPF